MWINIKAYRSITFPFSDKGQESSLIGAPFCVEGFCRSKAVASNWFGVRSSIKCSVLPHRASKRISAPYLILPAHSRPEANLALLGPIDGDSRSLILITILNQFPPDIAHGFQTRSCCPRLTRNYGRCGQYNRYIGELLGLSHLLP